MRNLMLVLVLLVSGISFSQSHNDTLEKWYNENRLAVEKEFVRLIDSARSNLTIEKDFIYRSSDGLSQKELKSIKKKEESQGNSCQIVKKSKGNNINFIIISKEMDVVKMEYDSILSLASNHHAQYLSEVGCGATHGEWEKFQGIVSFKGVESKKDYVYEGDLPILYVPSDRVKYYCPNRVYVGECVSAGLVGHIATFDRQAAINYYVKNIDHVNVKSVANLFLKDFKNSPKHWEIFMSSDDIDLMGVSFIMDFNNSRMSFVTVMGKDKSKINTDLFDNQQ
jgi:hypothetical protein